jgi:hypothetical protein
MILSLRDVLVRAWQRGYSPDEIRGCIKADLGRGALEIDITHPSYPAAKKGPPQTKKLRDYLAAAVPVYPGIEVFRPAAVTPEAGPGTELKKLLRTIGIQATPNCSCNARARTMDANGCGWCEANIDTIVGWLREEATKRKLPFVDMAGRLLVRRAIRNARRAAS